MLGAQAVQWLEPVDGVVQLQTLQSTRLWNVTCATGLRVGFSSFSSFWSFTCFFTWFFAVRACQEVARLGAVCGWLLQLFAQKGKELVDVSKDMRVARPGRLQRTAPLLRRTAAP
jgi:hypothetical protein